MGFADQRRTVRISVPPARDVAVLRVGRRSLPAQLCNESCGGFGIRVPHDAVVSVGQSVVFGWVGGWCQVRVAFLGRDEDGINVGLERLIDLPADWPTRNLWNFWLRDRLRIPLPSLSWSPSVTGGLVVCGFIVAVIIWGLMPKREHVPGTLRQSNFVSSSRDTREAPSSFGTPSASERNAPGSVGVDSRTNGGRTTHAPLVVVERQIEAAGAWLGEAGSSVTQSLPNGSSDLRRAGATITKWGKVFDPASARLPDASVLLSPTVQQQLGITAEQLTEIRSIVRAGNDAAQEVYRTAHDGSSPIVRLHVGRLKRAASEQTMAVLTPYQRKLLDSLPKR